MQGWVDLAKLVSGGGGFKSVYKELAQKIGKNLYVAPLCLKLFSHSILVFVEFNKKVTVTTLKTNTLWSFVKETTPTCV